MANTIKIGNADVNFKVGSGDCKVYLGDVQMYPHIYENDYLTFEALESGTFSFSGNDLQYSVDGGEIWTTLTNGASTPSVSAGDKIMWKASGLTPTSGSGIGTFSSTGKFNAQGNAMSMQFGDNFIGKRSLASKTYAFRYLFNNCLGINDAKNLILPATTLAGSCYASMFSGCSGLTSAPELPATSMTGSCYQRMFQNCSSLTTPPRLPATSVNGNCYQNMFDGCTSLRTAPELPATTMAIRCYQYMFQNCKSLTTLPSLPATTLADYCYQNMFAACGITHIPSDLLPATTLADYCYQNMFIGCNSLVDASNLQLPSLTLATNCYQGMFAQSANLEKTPVLSASTLVQGCYIYMFQKSPKINQITCLATDKSASNCTTNWVTGVASAGTFVKAASMTSWPSGNSGIPNGWTVNNI